MQTSLNPATLRQTLSLDEFIDVTAQAGFEGFELRLAAAAEYVRQHGLAALRARLANAGLAVAGFGYPAPLRASAEQFETELAAVPAACELAAALGAQGGSVVLPFRQSDQYAITREETISRIGRIADLAAQHQLVLYLEFIGLHAPDDIAWSKTLGQALDIAEAVGRANVGVLVDSYHWRLGGTQERDLARIRPGQPVLLHINDAPAGAPVTLNDSMRVLPGEGVIDLPAWLQSIRAATGYDGFVSLELFSEELRAMEPLAAARRARQALDRVLTDLAARE